MDKVAIPFRSALASALICATNSPAQAQQASAPPRIAFNDVLAMPSEPSFEDAAQIGAVVISGNEAVPEERYQQVVENFFGEPLTDEVLEQLTDELTELAKEAGYPYAITSIDTDAAALGIVQIEIDEGRIDAIEIEGSDNAAAARMLQRLVGKPASRSELETTLLLVSDIPELRLRGARLRRDEGRGVLVVRLEERGPQFRIAADNYGSEEFGPIRARASIRYADVLTSTDRADAAIRVNPIEPSELLFASASYSAQVADNGTRVGVVGSIGRTAPGGELGDTEISGDTRRAGVNVSIPLRRTRSGSIWLEGQAAYISIAQEDLGTLLRDDTLVTASVGLRTRFAVAGGSASTGVWIDRGLDVLGATRLGDDLASRADGDGVFTRFRFNANARIPLADRLDLYLAANGQLADRPLLSSQEIALGGAFTTRGYGFAEVLGDEGVAGLAELRYRFNTSDIPLDFLQIYAFADGGYVSDIDATGGEGSLFSAGSGLRGRLGIFDFEVEGAFPLGGSGERNPSNDPEINVRAGVNF